MAYTEINARHDMAKRLFEAQHGGGGMKWIDAAPYVRRQYERDIEVLLDPRNAEVGEALRAIGFSVVGP